MSAYNYTKNNKSPLLLKSDLKDIVMFVVVGLFLDLCQW